MIQNQPNIQPTLLDRLIDDEPGLSREPVQDRLTTFGQIEARVARDLERLLNTRGPVIAPPPSYQELNHSLYTYGLSDFTSQSPKSQTVRQRLWQEIERAISRFEPRLRNVAVHIETSTEAERVVRFKISGLLVVDPVTEPVTFDTYFDINKGEYVVRK
ncbi:MAG: type VI secretion system baseplate subunit TssE [Deltaproteobacteria bacterium]|nr:MAG: type VI secretion system baseplate subunit TssE [Deltaproteobacteria bacterium]